MKPSTMEELVQEALAKEARDIAVPDVDAAWGRLAVSLCQEERKTRWPRIGMLAAGLAAGLFLSFLPPLQYAGQHVIGAVSAFYGPLGTERGLDSIITPPYASIGPNGDAGLSSRNGAQTKPNQSQGPQPAPTPEPNAPAPFSGSESQPASDNGEKVLTMAELKSLIPYPIPLPNYLPSDLKLERITYRKADPSLGILTFHYQGSQHSLTIRQSVPQDEATVAEIKKARIGDSDATVLAQKGGITIMWVKNSLKIELQTNLGEKEALQVAQSVAPAS